MRESPLVSKMLHVPSRTATNKNVPLNSHSGYAAFCSQGVLFVLGISGGSSILMWLGNLVMQAQIVVTKQ